MTASSPGNVHPIGRTSAPSLAPIMALVADGMNQVNSVILDRMQSRIPLIPELAGHLIAGGGKPQVPCLLITGDNGTQTWLYESDAINAYLNREFGAA